MKKRREIFTGNVPLLITGIRHDASIRRSTSAAITTSQPGAISEVCFLPLTTHSLTPDRRSTLTLQSRVSVKAAMRKCDSSR